jgi:flagellar basal body-associated protein FliL
MNCLFRRGVLAMMICLPAASFAAESPAGPSAPYFLSLGEFTVNLRDNSSHFDFVVINVTLELSPDVASRLKEITPRLKEEVMLHLMEMADRGELQPGHADPLIVKTQLADTLEKTAPEGIQDVLITRLLYG